MIAAVTPSSDVSIPSGAGLIDLSDYTVLPGLIDAHTHLLSDSDDHGLNSLVVSLPEATINGVKNAAITLQAGFTTVRNVGAPGYADVALRDAIAAGEVAGPRMLVSGPGIGITGGHCSDNNLLPYEYGVTEVGVADGPWQIRQMVRQNVKFGVDLDQDVLDGRSSVGRYTARRGSVHAGGTGGAGRRSAHAWPEGRGPCPWHGGHPKRDTCRRRFDRTREFPHRRSDRACEGAWHVVRHGHLCHRAHSHGGRSQRRIAGVSGKGARSWADTAGKLHKGTRRRCRRWCSVRTAPCIRMGTMPGSFPAWCRFGMTPAEAIRSRNRPCSGPAGGRGSGRPDCRRSPGGSGRRFRKSPRRCQRSRERRIRDEGWGRLQATVTRRHDVTCPSDRCRMAGEPSRNSDAGNSKLIGET